MKKIITLLLLLIVSKLATAQLSFDNETFPYNGFNVNHYGLWWYPDPDAIASGPMAYLSSFGGIKFFTHGSPKAVIDVHGNVGIGTTNPAQKLTVLMDGSTNGAGIAVQAVNHNGTGSQPGTAYLNETGVKRMYSYLDIATDTYNIANAASSNILSITQAGNVSIGTANAQGYMFAVNGSAIATSMTVKLNANWPDYVFKKDYQLPTLQEVKTYIDENQHLPDMPSADEITKDGQNLGEMNKLLVKKVEELTLYLIEKDRKEKEQEQINAKLLERLNKLEAKLDNINNKKH